MKKFAFILILVLLTTNSYGIENSFENREAQAQRYLNSTPPRALFEDLAEKVSVNLPPEDRQLFKDLLTKHLDLDSLTKSIESALINNFTADELSALADFYGSPIGKSAMSKMGNYMAEVMPAMETELQKSFAKANLEFGKQDQ
ncbi:MAG: hypothetical protein C0622_06880 [Desulfuromonas sp.]|nr:MAG: hypothetical protein C0622_06880 [Desulfuromonas sp.]